MSAFFLFFGPFYVLAALAWEFRKNRKNGLEPSSLKVLWRWAQKNKAPNPKIPAYLFSLQVFLIFSFWESFLMDLLEHQKPWPIRLLGLLWLLGEMFLRTQKRPMPPVKVGWYEKTGSARRIISWIVLYGGPVSLICGVWLYWREKQLSSSQIAKT